MRWGRLQIALLAVMLLFANAWCVAQCSVAPCQSGSTDSAKLPPCHRHHAPKSDPSVKPCPSSAFVETANSAFHAPLAVMALVPAKDVLPAPLLRAEEFRLVAVSPPPPLVSTPLRA